MTNKKKAPKQGDNHEDPRDDDAKKESDGKSDVANTPVKLTPGKDGHARSVARTDAARRQEKDNAFESDDDDESENELLDNDSSSTANKTATKESTMDAADTPSKDEASDEEASGEDGEASEKEEPEEKVSEANTDMEEDDDYIVSLKETKSLEEKDVVANRSKHQSLAHHQPNALAKPWPLSV
jgi:hypothetical protein